MAVEARMNHAPAQNPHLGMEGGYCHPGKAKESHTMGTRPLEHLGEVLVKTASCLIHYVAECLRRALVLSQGRFCPLGDFGDIYTQFWLSQLRGSYYWHLVGRKMVLNFYNAQGSTPHPHPPTKRRVS